MRNQCRSRLSSLTSLSPHISTRAFISPAGVTLFGAERTGWTRNYAIDGKLPTWQLGEPEEVKTTR
jgi:hypothetical protein